jgi:hypothetical protein
MPIYQNTDGCLIVDLSLASRDSRGEPTGDVWVGVGQCVDNDRIDELVFVDAPVGVGLQGKTTNDVKTALRIIVPNKEALTQLINAVMALPVASSLT